jgi:hypothetical protein
MYPIDIIIKFLWIFDIIEDNSFSLFILSRAATGLLNNIEYEKIWDNIYWVQSIHP